MLTVASAEAVPETAEIYLIGGGEDLPQVLAASKLNASRSLHRAVDGGAVVLAICAGLQILGHAFVGPDGGTSDGLGLLGCVTVRSDAPRAIGEILVQPAEEWSGTARPAGAGTPGPGSPASPAGPGLGLLSGFENHGAVTELIPGTGTRPVGTVITGVGNKDGTLEGAVTGRVWGTYLHGPVLARNPRLADLLLSWVVGDMPPVAGPEADALHAERVEHGPLERHAGGTAGQRPRRFADAFARRGLRGASPRGRGSLEA